MTMFFHCKKAELTHPDTGAVHRAAVSADSEGDLLVALPQDTEFPVYTPVEALLFDPFLGVVRCRCSLALPDCRGGLCSYRCQVLERLSQEQRREDIKVSLSAKVAVTLEGAARRAEAVLYNISAGGVYLVTELKAQPGDRLTFPFPQADGPIPLTARVLRAEDRTDRRGHPVRGYGCRFEDLLPQHESRLRRYVFQEEKRLHQREP